MKAIKSNDKKVLSDGDLIKANLKKLSAILVKLEYRYSVKAEAEALYKAYEYISPKDGAIGKDKEIAGLLNQMRQSADKALKEYVFFAEKKRTQHLSAVSDLVAQIKILIEER